MAIGRLRRGGGVAPQDTLDLLLGVGTVLGALAAAGVALLAMQPRSSLRHVDLQHGRPAPACVSHYLSLPVSGLAVLGGALTLA